MSNNNNTTKLIVLGGAALATVGAYALYRHFSNKSDKSGANTPSEQSQPEVVAEPAAETKEAAVEVPSVAASENAVDANKKEENKSEVASDLPVPKETMIKIFTEISEIAQAIIMQLSQQEQMLAAQTGNNVELVRQIIMSSFNSELEKQEQEIYKKYKVNQEDVVETSNLLSEDIDFRRAIFALKNVASVLNGATPEDGHDLIPEEITSDVFLAIFEEVTTQTVASMEKTMDDFITKKGLKDREELKNELQKDSNLQTEFLTSYLEAGEVVKNGIFNKYNINAAIFQICMSYYPNMEEVATKMAEISNKLQSSIASLM